MAEESTYYIESRAQLFSALAEASEIEHNLMCLYLYAMFSLKRTEAEGVSAKELAAIERWRRIILGIALEEMNHLTLVSNLTSAVGGTPHFMRPNFPSSPGLYPADIVIELATFDLSTLDHFIYLERPRSLDIKDGETFQHSQKYVRLSEKGRLMPSSGDYQTVGDLYLSIKNAFEELCTKHEEKKLFCGAKDQQIGPLDSPLPGLILVTNKAEALKAIDTIITQGEGATDIKDSHFERFLSIKEEYELLLKENPNFTPARPVARNPVMRKPLDPQNRLWVTHKLAAQYMDLSNALYTMMLRLLVQIYTVENRPRGSKLALLNASYGLMHAMASVGETLTHLPVSDTQTDILSGMSFAMVRSLSPMEHIAEKQIFAERMVEVIENMAHLQKDLEEETRLNPHAKTCTDQLLQTKSSLLVVASEIAQMPDRIDPLTITETVTPSQPSVEPRVVHESAKTSSQFAHGVNTTLNTSLETSTTDAIEISFDAKKCMHARHCVTELPKVFKANTPGKWIYAENADPNILAAVIRECPSGALQFHRKDSGWQEPVPEVNLMHLRENGPYAFFADMTIDDKHVGTRATLCRCGQSQNKPFCDASHNTARFTACGEPTTFDDTALANRGGVLKINRTKDGPLAISGNVEICTGTGRIALRTQGVKLCRCGNSKSKPICDSSHLAAGFKDEAPAPMPQFQFDNSQSLTEL